MLNRGYFGIGIVNSKNHHNIGTLWRSAVNFGANFIFTIGKRYTREASDTCSSIKHIPLYHYADFEDFNKHRPHGCDLVAVEQTNSSRNIVSFIHPERCIYLLGAEDHGLPTEAISKSQSIIHIDTPLCLNVAVAGSIVMFSRKSSLIYNN